MTQDSGYETRKRLTLQALAQIKAATAWSKDQIEYAQRAQLVDLIQFVASNVSYYQERLTTLGDFDGFRDATCKKTWRNCNIVCQA